MKLHFSPTSPYVRKVRACAITRGIDNQIELMPTDADASVPRRAEIAKPQDAGRVAWIARQKTAVDRTLDALEADPPHRSVDIGSLAAACALGYLDFRYAAQPWRPAHPKLAAWYEAFARNPGIANTVPKDG